ncbi:MAG: formylglycine-generating enzyme family protein [Kiritimatiellae bacterium]|nr:formylglycine-generating enzyme family protein [Kiritimatiellia bacterium]
MKKQMIAMVAVGLLGANAFAGDPGGVPGFAEATFSSATLDTTSEIVANVSRLTCTPNLYTQYFGQYTTVGARAYMYLEGGVTYNFRYYYRYAYATLIINGLTVLSKGTSSSTSKSADFTPVASDWYPIELRAGCEGSNGGIYSSSYYGLQWKKATESSYSNFADPGDGSIFKTGFLSTLHFKETSPVILSSAIRANDPTILDVTYMVTSDKPTVNVRALAFENGERNFFFVVRPTAFVKDADGNETAQNIGDGIEANVEHKLAWKVSQDWKTDLAKAKFEILTSEMGTLPMEWINIPATKKNGSFTVSYGTQKTEDVFNAMLWYYASGAEDLMLDNGYLTATNHVTLADGAPLVSRTEIPYAGRLNVIEYIYDKMGYGILNGVIQEYARRATRKELIPGGVAIYAYKRKDAPSQIYLGEKKYCVIDVSAGENATSYPVTYLDSAPTAGWGDEYKTTKIVLRRIEPGTFNMSGRTTTLTKPYYMGVFPVTQKQYQLVTGSDPSYYKGDMRPVENVSWNMIRGNSSTYNWPTVKTVDANSFVGRIQARTGFSFDLPTEAQWEYACRAGTTGNYNNGSDCNLLGRIRDTQKDLRGGFLEHTIVGQYLSNDWGLYDMHGEVHEWCLDWYEEIDTQVTASDPIGAASGYGRIWRSYSWAGINSYDARSGARHDSDPSIRDGGFRLGRTLGNE